MNTLNPIRTILVGASPRTENTWIPLVRSFDGDLELAGVWSRTPASAERLGKKIGCAWDSDFERLLTRVNPRLAIVCVTAEANGRVGAMVVGSGLHAVLDTPIAWRLGEADRITALAKERNVKVEVAEQTFRLPSCQIVGSLVRSGAFGHVHTVISDGSFHEYHAMSLIRSLLGFDKKPVRATGEVRFHPLANPGGNGEEEICLTGIISFETGEIAVYHWANGGYHSPIRRYRGVKFLGERGSGRIDVVRSDGDAEIRVDLSVIDHAGRPCRCEPVRHVDAENLLREMSVRSEDGAIDCRWVNPLHELQAARHAAWNDDRLAIALCLHGIIDAVRNDGEPPYGVAHARLDQELCIAVRQSSGLGGRPVNIPIDNDDQPY